MARPRWAYPRPLFAARLLTIGCRKPELIDAAARCEGLTAPLRCWSLRSSQGRQANRMTRNAQDGSGHCSQGWTLTAGCCVRPMQLSWQGRRAASPYASARERRVHLEPQRGATSAGRHVALRADTLMLKPVDRGRRLRPGFGIRCHPILKTRQMHPGIDWAGAARDPGTRGQVTAGGRCRALRCLRLLRAHRARTHGRDHLRSFDRYAPGRAGRLVHQGDLITVGSAAPAVPPARISTTRSWSPTIRWTPLRSHRSCTRTPPTAAAPAPRRRISRTGFRHRWSRHQRRGPGDRPCRCRRIGTSAPFRPTPMPG